MSKFTYCFMVLALVGCEKSLAEQRKGELEVQRQADEKTAVGIEGTRQKVEQARKEASKDIAVANNELQQRTRAAIDEGKETIRNAHEAVLGEAQDSAQALRKSGAELRKPIEAELDALDRRATAARQALSKKTGAVRTTAETQLNDISARSQSLRTDLREFEVKTIRSVEEFKGNLDQRLIDLRRSVDRAEGGS